MPRVVQDAELQGRLNRFLQESGVSVAQAAKEFGVDRVSLWRFSATGKALEATRVEYRNALDRATNAKNETGEAVSFKEISAGPKVSMDDRELRLIRQTCECVLKLLDAYEGRLSASVHQRH